MPLPGPESASSFANAQDLAYGAIRNWIFNGPLKPGEIVRDIDVANLLGISRTPVREAIIRLIQEGLIDPGKGRKTRVSIPDLRRAPDLYRIGGVLDGLAAEWAMPKLAGSDLERMKDLHALMEGETDAARLVTLDLQLHAVFRALAGDVLAGMLETIELEIGRFERLAFDDAEIRSLTRGDHHAIIDAFASGKARAAADAVRQNWLNAWKRLETRLRLTQQA
jgi:DNA-binding GntR family transcriptional regulator